MSGWLLDTNVLSELRKTDRCDPAVRSWFAGIKEEELHTSVLVVGEIRGGIERLRRRDPEQSAAIERWLGRLRRRMETRVLPIDEQIAETWGRLRLGQPLSVVDGLLAATAQVHSLTLVTRNTRHFRDCNVAVLDPFEP